MLDKSGYINEATGRFQRAKNEYHEVVWNFLSLITVVPWLIATVIYLIFAIVNWTIGKGFNGPFWKILGGNYMFFLTLGMNRFLVEFFEKRDRYRFYKKFETHYDEINKLLNGTNAFALYLREFKSGIDESVNVVVKEGVYALGHGNRRMEFIILTINSYMPVVFIDSSYDLTPNEKGLPVFSSDKNWRRDFETIAHSAKYIIFDYDKEFLNSENIQFEISFVMQHNKKVFLFCSYEAKDELLAAYPQLFEYIVFFNPVERNKNQLSTPGVIGRDYEFSLTPEAREYLSKNIVSNGRV